ncbi:porin [Paraburkholderia sp. JPY465]|uniref:porin n=1 Tax=Paraburkholderia sp. JPY465 TaxID=3042285 RepID=UPI003D2317C9
MSNVAHAQNSVTLYGILDAGLAYSHNAVDASGRNQSTLFKQISGAVSSVRWGMRGREDLGGGLAAIFTIESGFDLGSGASRQGGRLFGRQSLVGLSDTRWGTVTIGRQYDPTVNAISELTENGYYAAFSPPGNLDNYDAGGLRVSNSVKYVSPVVAGLRFEALYGFGGVAGSLGNGETYAFSLDYKHGPLRLGAAYFNANGGNTTSGGYRTWTGSSDSLPGFFSTPVTQGFATAKSIQIARVAGDYTVGASRIGIAYSNTQYVGDGLSRFKGTARFNNGAAFYEYHFAPGASAALGYNYTSLTGPTSAHYHQVNLGFDYLLSKQTDLYAAVGYQHAYGKTLDATGTVVDARAAVGDLVINSGANSQLLTVAGIRHRF